jgi:hypothetical protein
MMGKRIAAGGGLCPQAEDQTMRRFLIGLTVTLLLIVSVGVGVAVALWPRWR